ncbi:MAG: class I SAM-dependent methyltransferase [Sporichthyaceae bacterium]|nr:class I SAM-dependent methyltransferase [Sporichthyaceae bacterium]
MSLEMHELAEAGHDILNPFTPAKLALVGEVARIGLGTRILDLACGKGALLSTWAAELGSSGHGVDLSDVFLAAARARAIELGVSDRVSFEQGDAGRYVTGGEPYDVVACIGASWIADGLPGTLDLLRQSVRPDGVVLVGEPYWTEDPPAEALDAVDAAPALFTTLAGTGERFEQAGYDLVEMVVADGDSWDRYAASQWWTLAEWLRANPDDARAPAVRAFRDDARRSHLAYVRRYLGWGVFVLRPLG